MNIHKLNRHSKIQRILIFFIFWLVSLTHSSFSKDLSYQGLPPGEGRWQVLKTCTPCHSTGIILQNHMSRKWWDRTITWMQEKQGLQILDPVLRKTILDYLTQHLGVEKFTGQPASPMGHQYRYMPNPL